MQFTMTPIGVVHTPFHEHRDTPRQPLQSQAAGVVEVHSQYVPGLDGIERFSHITLVFVFDRSSDYTLHVTPPDTNQARGVFATRSPQRPNPLGLSTVRLLAREGNLLRVEGVDMLDGTPILDIKPYVRQVEPGPDA